MVPPPRAVPEHHGDVLLDDAARFGAILNDLPHLLAMTRDPRSQAVGLDGHTLVRARR